MRVIGLYPANEPVDGLDAFVTQTGVTFRLVPDVDRSFLKFEFPEGVNFPYPRDVVIDSDLTVRSIKNSFDADEMQQLIDELLAD
ncbi:MAG: hypothetical protein KTR31_08175 [Myxococcales bacterium]|nr:hypothetical protein [Myxococcales bacterium]